jgi:hypothetical protein
MLTSPRASGPRAAAAPAAGLAAAPSQPPPPGALLSSELLCAICQELFVEARTIECGHSFCGQCIECWLRKSDTCPTCRAPVSNPPVRSMCLDRAVEFAVLSLNSSAALECLLFRRSECAKARSCECLVQAKLEELLSKARMRGVKIVSIAKPWSASEKDRFQMGIAKHQGQARESYCNVVGLTLEWIAEAPYEQLLVASANVRLPASMKDGAEWTLACLRRRLEFYVRVG